jgi:hypothetical protein
MGGKVETVRCEIKYSRAGRTLVFALSCTTMGLAAALPVALGWRLAAVAWVVLHAIRAWRALGAAVRLSVARDGNIRVEVRDGTALEGNTRPGSFVAPWLTIVRWRPAGRRLDRTLLLLPGMAAPDEMRNIRVILRWG